MRRALIVLLLFLVLGVAVIVVIRLRVTGGIQSPLDVAATEQDANRPVWPSIESEKTPPTPPPPPPTAIGTQVPAAPPEGWVWWGSMAFRKDAKIQSNYEDNGLSGYEVPVLYMRDGALVVASKYPDHSACIWSYDTATGKFTVLYRKTRQAIKRFLDCEYISDLNWYETAREYTWKRDDMNWVDKDPKLSAIVGKYASELSKPPRREGRLWKASLYGGAKDEECYDRKWNSIRTEGAFLESRSQKGWVVPLNGGALELSLSYSDIGVNIPLLGTELRMPPRITLELRDTVTQKLLSSLPMDESDTILRLWDFGRGLAMIESYSMRGPGSRVPPRMVLLKYPELRIVARADFPMAEFETMNSISDGLALDFCAAEPYSSAVYRGPEKPPPYSAPSNTPKLFRLRVPNNWRDARGQKNTSCIWEEPARDLATLELTRQGDFDVAKHDAYECSEVKGDATPKNLKSPCVYRDSIMYWRKFHTGEVVMASLDNLDAQTVIGGAGVTWDGFRVNPARDEVVTWRENGEIVFWKVQFPNAEPLFKARVVTDETPHRLEAK